MSDSMDVYKDVLKRKFEKDAKIPVERPAMTAFEAVLYEATYKEARRIYEEMTSHMVNWEKLDD